MVQPAVTETDATPSLQLGPAVPVRKKPSEGRELKPPAWFEERLRPHEESVVEAIAHALVRTAQEESSPPKE